MTDDPGLTSDTELRTVKPGKAPTSPNSDQITSIPFFFLSHYDSNVQFLLGPSLFPLSSPTIMMFPALPGTSSFLPMFS
jgi:hypothetical protein